MIVPDAWQDSWQVFWQYYFLIFNWYLPFSASDFIFDFSNSGYVSGNRQASHCLVWLWSFFQCFVTGQRISAVFFNDPVPMKMLTSCYQSASSREFLSIRFRPALTSWLLSWLLWRSFKDVRNDFKLSNLHVFFFNCFSFKWAGGTERFKVLMAEAPWHCKSKSLCGFL